MSAPRTPTRKHLRESASHLVPARTHCREQVRRGQITPLIHDLQLQQIARDSLPTAQLSALFFFVVVLISKDSQYQPPVFVDVTDPAGIAFRHNNGGFGKKYLPETMGSGCAFFDYDKDGWVDIFLVNSCDWPAHRRSTSVSALCRNQKGQGFRDVTADSGLAFEAYSMGVAVGDYDNDGWDDLYISGLDGGRLFHNGEGRFVDVTAEAGIHNPGFGASSMWLDFDKDGQLDLFVCNYAKWSESSDRFCSYDGVNKNYCSPADYPPDSPRLFRNLGNGRFSDVSKEAGIYSPDCKSLGVVALDFNRDGWPDIFVANDTTPHKLFRNNRNGTFDEVGLEATVALDGNGKTRAGMGVDFADYDHSGYPSLVIGNFSSETLSLYHNIRGEFFVDRADTVGISRESFFRLTFGCLFLDYDLDGWEDLLTANGHIMDDIHSYDSKLTYAQPALLFHNEEGGKFTSIPAQAAPHLFTPAVGRGLASADIDNDGDLDVLLTQNNGTPRLLRNEGQFSNHWLQISTVGTRSNRNGYGAFLSLSTGKSIQTRTVKSSSSYCSQSDSLVSFGLGRNSRVDRLEILWPSGIKEEYRDLPVDQRIVLTESRGWSKWP
ncbi:MAG: CRTAC1 family protein [Acidobacteriota bacterium]